MEQFVGHWPPWCPLSALVLERCVFRVSSLSAVSSSVLFPLLDNLWSGFYSLLAVMACNLKERVELEAVCPDNSMSDYPAHHTCSSPSLPGGRGGQITPLPA